MERKEDRVHTETAVQPESTLSGGNRVHPSGCYFKVAIVVDWENIRYKVFANPKLKSPNPSERFSYNAYTERLPVFLLNFLEPNEIPYRIFIYASKPFEQELRLPSHIRLSPEEKKSKENEINLRIKRNRQTYENFLKRLGKCSLIALRLGKTVFRGWKVEKDNYKPDLVQKKVDMLMGLDIAHLAYKRLVDRIIIFSYDTDMQPAFKTARLEGIQVVLPVFTEIKDEIPSELFLHSDFIRERRYFEICQKLYDPKH
ncbi:hypothetical protein Thein_1971 [Thermodesulfatator indicus DSM 15286]|uniref:Uncharacterized protein n=1 Tax=Thermodesulfatator indicus (strain DSM 15286 / JCM 11887 / CIR29812) TaxID=667014 RepID=F8ACP6_THEID|nr:NYN domain-containing protein [Thermodesulfatator indicus]AEH45825.1 hypothetical protein Thein_1971 [Thermodesulfatator indicus DSM 15286]